MPRRSQEDPYVYPGTDVLKNKFDLRDHDELSLRERQSTHRRTFDLQRVPVRGSFDAMHLADIHYALFQDVYPWAGEFRTVDIRKWSEDFKAFTNFIPAEVAVTWLNKYLHDNLPPNGLRGLAHDQFVEKATRIYLDVNAIHPFPEGNGRTQREFLRVVALHAGYELDWSRVDSDKLLSATIRTQHDPTAKPSLLHPLIAAGLVNKTPSRALQDQWDHPPRDPAIAKKFPATRTKTRNTRAR